MGLAWVYWRIYSLRVEQYIPRRFAPLDILHNPSGVYYPIYPCHAHYIITIQCNLFKKPMFFYLFFFVLKTIQCNFLALTLYVGNLEIWFFEYNTKQQQFLIFEYNTKFENNTIQFFWRIFKTIFFSKTIQYNPTLLIGKLEISFFFKSILFTLTS